MALTQRPGFGTQLLCDPTGGSTFALLGAVVDTVDGPDVKVTEIDTTILGAKSKTYLPGDYDAGHLTFSIAYDPADTGTTTVLTALMTSGAIANWEVSIPAVGSVIAVTEHFLGFVASLSRKITKGKMIIMDVTVKVTGVPGFTGE